MHGSDTAGTSGSAAWEPCGGCWGQRRIWHTAPGHGLVGWQHCPTCLGLGERMVLIGAAQASPTP